MNCLTESTVHATWSAPAGLTRRFFSHHASRGGPATSFPARLRVRRRTSGGSSPSAVAESARFASSRPDSAPGAQKPLHVKSNPSRQGRKTTPIRVKHNNGTPPRAAGCHRIERKCQGFLLCHVEYLQSVVHHYHRIEVIYAPTSDLEPFAYTLSNAPLRMPHVVTTKKQSASNVESIMNLTLLGQN